MHAEDVPAIFKFATKHHTAARGVNGRGFNGVVIQGPNHVADGALIIHAHGEMDVWGHAKILFPKMIDRLVASTQFAAGRTQHEIRIETKGQLVGICVVEGFRAETHCLVHICNKRRLSGTSRRAAEARHAMLQVDCYTQLLQEIHAENPVEWTAARFGDCVQVNRREADASQTVAA